MSNPVFDALLADMKAMHDRKAADYASDANKFSNFEEAGAIAHGFTDPVDIAFAVLIGVKIARLKELKGKGKAAQNESVADSHLDLAVYASLWASYERKRMGVSAPSAPTPGATNRSPCYCLRPRPMPGEMGFCLACGGELPIGLVQGVSVSLTPQSR